MASRDQYVSSRSKELKEAIEFYEALQTSERLARGLDSSLLIKEAEAKLETLRMMVRECGMAVDF